MKILNKIEIFSLNRTLLLLMLVSLPSNLIANYEISGPTILVVHQKLQIDSSTINSWESFCTRLKQKFESESTETLLNHFDQVHCGGELPKNTNYWKLSFIKEESDQIRLEFSFHSEEVNKVTHTFTEEVGQGLALFLDSTDLEDVVRIVKLMTPYQGRLKMGVDSRENFTFAAPLDGGLFGSRIQVNKEGQFHYFLLGRALQQKNWFSWDQFFSHDNKADGIFLVAENYRMKTEVIQELAASILSKPSGPVDVMFSIRYGNALETLNSPGEITIKLELLSGQLMGLGLYLESRPESLFENDYENRRIKFSQASIGWSQSFEIIDGLSVGITGKLGQALFENDYTILEEGALTNERYLFNTAVASLGFRVQLDIILSPSFWFEYRSSVPLKDDTKFTRSQSGIEISYPLDFWLSKLEATGFLEHQLMSSVGTSENSQQVMDVWSVEYLGGAGFKYLF